MALVAVTNPLPEPLPPKRGGGYVELGAHVVVCSLFSVGLGLAEGLDVTTCFAMVLGLVVVGRVVVEVASGVSRP